MRLENKVAVVTGGASGIGQATCVLLAEEGASVCFGDINEEGGEETLSQIQESGGNAHFIGADVSQESECQRLVDEAVNVFGGVNILVNNAARFIFRGLDATPDEWDEIMRTNVFGYAYMMRYAAEEMRKAGGGSVVNLGSISSVIAQSEFVTYNAAKGAVAQLTRCSAMDLAPDNIRVNAVCPGLVWTGEVQKMAAEEGLSHKDAVAKWGPHQFLQRPADPREIAYAILFLASDESSFVTGSLLFADGGYTAQ